MSGTRPFWEGSPPKIKSVFFVTAVRQPIQGLVKSLENVLHNFDGVRRTDRQTNRHWWEHYQMNLVLENVPLVLVLIIGQVIDCHCALETLEQHSERCYRRPWWTITAAQFARGRRLRHSENDLYENWKFCDILWPSWLWSAVNINNFQAGIWG